MKLNRRSLIKGLIAAPFIAALAPVVSAKNFVVEKVVGGWSKWEVWRHGGLGFASRWRMIDKPEVNGEPGKFEMQFLAEGDIGKEQDVVWNINIDEKTYSTLNEKLRNKK